MKRILASGLGALWLSGCLLIDDFADEYRVGAPCRTHWSKAYPGSVVTQAIAARPAHVYVIGSFAGTLDLDFKNLVASEGNGFIIGLDNDGQFEDATDTASVGVERPTVVDAAGERITLAGSFSGRPCVCDPVANSGVFVASGADFPALKNMTKACISVTGDVDVHGMIVQENVVRIVGIFSGMLDGHASEDEDGFVASFDLAGGACAPRVIFVAGGPGDQSVKAIARVSDGGFVAAGNFDEQLQTSTSSALGNRGEGNFFLAAFDDRAQLRTLRTYGDEAEAQVSAVRSVGSVLYVAGELDEGTLALGHREQDQIRSDGESVSGFIFALNFDGVNFSDPLWATRFTGEDLDLNGLVETAEGLYVGGAVDGSLDLSSGRRFEADHETEDEAEDLDMFVARFDRMSGEPSWGMRCGDGLTQQIVGLAADFDDDAVFFAADLNGAIDLGPGQVKGDDPNTRILLGEFAPPNL